MQSLVFLACFFSKVIEGKPLASGSTPSPLGQEGLPDSSAFKDRRMNHFIICNKPEI